MKWLNIVFFYVYSTYYKDGKSYNDEIPASSIVAASTATHLLNIFVILTSFITGKKTHLNNYILISWMLFGALIYIYFCFNKRYVRIYNYYKKNNILKKHAKVLSWIYVFSAFALSVLISFLLKWLKDEGYLS